MYTFPFKDKDTFTKAYFIHKRDSVMKINIPGEREGMYMETADSSLVDVRNIAVKGDYAFEVRGLWEMKMTLWVVRLLHTCGLTVRTLV